MAGPLAVFAPLLGHCYAATLAPGVVDRHCFTPVYAGAHVRDVHVVTARGKPVYRGETIYSADTAGIAFTYVYSSGGVGHGRAVAGDGGIDFDGSMEASPGAAPVPMKSRWTYGRRRIAVTHGDQPTRDYRRQ